MANDLAIRKRIRRRELPGGVRFLTFSCNRRLPLLGSASLRDMFAACLLESRAKHRFELFAWVVMPEHVHLLMRPAADSSAESALRSLKMSVTKRAFAAWMRVRAPVLSKIAGPDGHPRFWQPGGGFDRNVRDVSEFCREVRYIHRNPIDRGLVSGAADWKWSSVRWWMGERDGEVPCDPPPERSNDWDNWRGFV